LKFVLSSRKEQIDRFSLRDLLLESPRSSKVIVFFTLGCFFSKEAFMSVKAFCKLAAEIVNSTFFLEVACFCTSGFLVCSLVEHQDKASKSNIIVKNKRLVISSFPLPLKPIIIKHNLL
jgi:hypothetical protein